MLELRMIDNTWTPPKLPKLDIKSLINDAKTFSEDRNEWIIILRIKPYIDTLYIDFSDAENYVVSRTKRFIFKDGYSWDYVDEKLFEELCLENELCQYKYGQFDEIYKYYSKIHPEWQLKRYYTESIRLLDHIYHCMRKGTVKELLYKTNLIELARRSDEIDEVNLLSSSPSEIYDNVPIRTLRALNCEIGAEMLCEHDYRELLKTLGKMDGTLFKHPLNDAQCAYIKYLYDRELTPKEIVRIFAGRRKELSGLWNARQFRDFLCKIKLDEKVSELTEIDPIYSKYLTENIDGKYDDEIGEIEYYLIHNREEFDRKIRVSNRKRDYEWQERNEDYIVRYPQTINDFCREAVYMSNCLLGYVDAFINNVTTILFMRRADDVNKPFITIEIYNNELKQAYHRYNEDCSVDEARWIKLYCDRHVIDSDSFHFDVDLDMYGPDD